MPLRFNNSINLKCPYVLSRLVLFTKKHLIVGCHVVVIIHMKNQLENSRELRSEN